MYEFEIVFPKGKAWVYADDETKARATADRLGCVPIISIKQVSTVEEIPNEFLSAIASLQ